MIHRVGSHVVTSPPSIRAVSLLNSSACGPTEMTQTYADRILRGCEADEQSRATGCGVGSQGRGRGEFKSAKHGPRPVPGNRVTGPEAHTAFRENITTRRHTPEVIGLVRICARGGRAW